jgi:hypothetical protein
MILSHINRIIHERNTIKSTNLKFHQIYNIQYTEKGGAPMITIGGIIDCQEADILEKANQQNFDFIRINQQSFYIELPNLTYKEKDLINAKSNDMNELLSMGILTKTEIETYLKIYKYLPSYFDVRM